MTVRIWTFHPSYLDRQGLLALWRETLLAQKVLRGLTRGYRNHPQLTRFRAHADPVEAIGYYLAAVHDESLARDYQFDRSKVLYDSPVAKIPETEGQLVYEWKHFMAKLAVRDVERFKSLSGIGVPNPHPLFIIIDGEVRSWERTKK